MLDEQGADLIGGHTMESRSNAPKPTTLGIEIVLTVNGEPKKHLRKSGIRSGDALLLSRPLGTGIILAGAMTGETKANELDALLLEMNKSQHHLLEDLQMNQTGIHACTDITGFGLLGHLSEMLEANSGPTLQLTDQKFLSMKVH